MEAGAHSFESTDCDADQVSVSNRTSMITAIRRSARSVKKEEHNFRLIDDVRAAARLKLD